MLRILFVNPVAGRSAEDLHIAAFVRAGRAAGHHIELVNPIHDEAEEISGNTPGHYRAKWRAKAGWFAYLLRDILMWITDTFRSMRLARKYSQRRSDFDVVYYRGGMSLFDSSGRRIARDLGLPLLLELNAFPDTESDIRRRPMPLRRLIVRYIAADVEQASVIFVVSHELARAVRGRSKPGKRVVVNPNGVDLSSFRPTVDGTPCRESLGVASGDILIGYAGSFQSWQGVLTLVHSFANVVRENRSLGAHLLLIGEGPDVPAAERLAADLQVAHRVHICGRLPHSSMPGVLAACDILTAPYERLESFYFSPLKVFEYLALGKPTVASRAGQLEEILTHRESAILIDPGSREQLTAAISELASDQTLRQKIGRAAASVATRYTWAKNFARVAECACTVSATESYARNSGSK